MTEVKERRRKKDSGGSPPLERFALRFGTGGHEIDAASYGRIISNIAVLLQEVSNELETSADYAFKVTAEKQGSFETEFAIRVATGAAVLSPLLTAENIRLAKKYAGKVVSCLGKGFELVKKLKGESPKAIDAGNKLTVVVVGNNNTITVENEVASLVLSNEKGQNAMTDTFDALSKEEKIDGFEIIDKKGKPLFTSERSEFPQLTSKLAVRETETKRNLLKKATLSITRQSFERNKNSDFNFAGNSISAAIADDQFWNSVEQGERFALGDKLKVELEIYQEFNRALDVWENKSYRVLKVLDHIARPKQGSLIDGRRLKTT